MAEIQSKIARIRRRMRLFRTLDALLWGLVGGAALFALAVLAHKLLFAQTPYDIIAALAFGVPLVVALGWGLLPRLTMFQAALYADTRLALRERLSSALLLEPASADPAVAALEADAIAFARNINPSRDFRYRLPRHARHTLWPAMAIIAVVLMPHFHLLKPAAQNANVPVIKTPEQVAAAEEKKKELIREIEKLAAKAQTKEEELSADEDLKLAERLERLREDLSRGKKNTNEAVAEMSRMSDDLRLREREINKRLQDFRQIKGLERAEETQALQQDLKNQNFAAAAQKLEQMAQDIQQGKMSPERMDQLAKEMQQLAEAMKENPAVADALNQAAQQIQQAAQQQQQANNQQQNANQNQQAANQGNNQQEQSNAGQSQQSGQQTSQNQQGASGQNPNSPSKQGQQQQAQAASASLQQAAAQMADMQQMMAQAQSVAEMQASMGQCMSSAQAGAMQSGQSNKQGQGGQQGNQQGQSGQMGQQGQAGMAGQGQGNPSTQAGQGQWQQGQSVQQGMGSGGPGTGMGGQVPDDGTMGKFVDEFIPGQQNEGQIIGVYETDAPAPRGESNVTYSRVPQTYRQQAADALSSQEIPAGLRNSVRDYFEQINFAPQGGQAPAGGKQQGQ